MDPTAADDAYGPHSYGDAFADVYDDWYPPPPDTDDAVALLAALAGDGPVLELGAGTGRLAIPLAATGLEVWGVDASAAMLERLRAKPGGDRVVAVLGDMASLDLSVASRPVPAFRLAFAALNTFFNLDTAAAQARCLARVRSVLAPGGRFVLEAFVPAADPAADTVVARAQVQSATTVLTVTNPAPMEQVVVGRHVEMAPDGVRERAWRLRYAAPDRARRDGGRRRPPAHARWGGWHREPFDGSSAMHVSVYEAR